MRHVSEQNFRRRPVERRAIMPLHVSQWSSAFSRMGESHLIFCRGHTDPNILTKARHDDSRASFWASVMKNGEGNARRKKLVAHTDAPHLVRLLSPSHNWSTRHRATKKSDELAPPHALGFALSHNHATQ